jgi:hypothetical protein
MNSLLQFKECQIFGLAKINQHFYGSSKGDSLLMKILFQADLVSS